MQALTSTTHYYAGLPEGTPPGALAIVGEGRLILVSQWAENDPRAHKVYRIYLGRLDEIDSIAGYTRPSVNLLTYSFKQNTFKLCWQDRPVKFKTGRMTTTTELEVEFDIMQFLTQSALDSVPEESLWSRVKEFAREHPCRTTLSLGSGVAALGLAGWSIWRVVEHYS